MSARTRMTAGSKERGWSRVVPEVFCLNSSPCRPRCSHHRRCTATMLSFARHTGVSFRFSISQDTLGFPFSSLPRKTHEFVGLFSSIHNESTSSPRRRRTAEQLHGPAATVHVCIFLYSDAIASASVFSWSGTARARSSARISDLG